MPDWLLTVMVYLVATFDDLIEGLELNEGEIMGLDARKRETGKSSLSKYSDSGGSMV